MGDFNVRITAGRAGTCRVAATGQWSLTIDSCLSAVFGFDDPARIDAACGNFSAGSRTAGICTTRPSPGPGRTTTSTTTCTRSWAASP